MTVTREQVSEFFDSLRCSQWGRSFDITSRDKREDAITFVVDLFAALESKEHG